MCEIRMNPFNLSSLNEPVTLSPEQGRASCSYQRVQPGALGGGPGFAAERRRAAHAVAGPRPRNAELRPRAWTQAEQTSHPDGAGVFASHGVGPRRGFHPPHVSFFRAGQGNSPARERERGLEESGGIEELAR